jgi:predicted nucleic acid-binding protein
MRILLDTNIVIHRETSVIMKDDIGHLFKWLDDLKYTKCIHPDTLEEIRRHKDPNVVKTMAVKLSSYHVLKTIAPVGTEVTALSAKYDKTPNDFTDTAILNEVFIGRVDLLITEDRNIHKKAKVLGCSERVFTIDSFLEKVSAEHPELVDYKVLSVRREHFGNINLADSFFDSFREDYPGFDKWFNKKADDLAYICSVGDQIVAFLYLKQEGTDENYSDITPPMGKARRLKIGTFKVVQNGFKIGERFLKIIFDNALRFGVGEIYVTIFNRTLEQKRLIGLLQEWGFKYHGLKESGTGQEQVFIRDFHPAVDKANPKLTFPYVDADANVYFVPIYPDYHTNLLPDSILNNESKADYVEHEPHRNAISKVYISRSFERGMKPGDLIVFYRTGGYYAGVVTTIGVVENVVLGIADEKKFIDLCRKRSVFDDVELAKHWNYKRNKPFIVNFLSVYSFPKRPNLAKLIELGVIADTHSVPQGFAKISKDDLERILTASMSDRKFLVNTKPYVAA